MCFAQIIKFWEDMHVIIVKILGYNIPKLCILLNFATVTGNVLKGDIYLLKILLAGCKKTITRKWYKTEPPTKDDWLKIVNEIYDMEQFTCKIRTEKTMSRKMGEEDCLQINDRTETLILMII